MSSATEPRRGHRFSLRVLGASAGSAGLSAAFSLVVGIAAIDHLVTSHGDQRLRGTTTILAGELLEDRDENGAESIAETVADENSELVTSGIRLAVLENGRLVAGDAWIPPVLANECETLGSGEARARVCGLSFEGRLLLLAAERRDDARLSWIYLSSAAIALLVAGVLAAISSLALTRWALRPLHQLSQAIRSMRPDAEAPNALAQPLATEEVEAIRGALWELLERSQALLRQAQTFAANAAHELRTPLTTICAELELLLETPLAEHDRAGLLRLRERTLRLAALVERLLVLATPLGARLPGEAVAMADMLEDVMAEIPAEARRRLRLNVSGEGLVRGEAALLRAMLRNALDNALKFSELEPVEVRLSESDTVSIEVSDQGRGVPEVERELVFEPFYRGSPWPVPGHGLGLALIAHIARAHAGTAQFLARERGACLRIELPRWQPLGAPPSSEPPGGGS
jgi:two-component system, OmpR family, sensor kinase